MALRKRTQQPKPQQPRAIIAAASRIDLTKKQPRPKRQDWQADALVYYDEVPEVKQLLLWRGNQISKLRLFAATFPDDAAPEDDPVGVDSEASTVSPELAAAAIEEIERIQSRLGGQSEVLRRLELNSEVVGECYIVGFGERKADPLTGKGGRLEDWTVCSIREVEYKPGQGPSVDGERPGQWVVKRQFEDGTNERVLDPDIDTIFRAWQPHAAEWDKADCSMRALLGECEALMLLSNQLKAESKSRASAGIFTVPNELSFGVPEAPVVEVTESDDGDTDTITTTEQPTPQDPLMQILSSALSGVVDDPLSIMSVVPLLLRGPGEFMKPDYLRKIDLSRQSDETLDKRINVRIQRVARGLNAPPEVVMGHQSTTYANARQVDIDTWDDYLEPKATWIVDLFTIGHLHDRLLQRGFDPVEVGRVFVWYDATGLVRQPDQADGADAAFDRVGISWSAYRRSKGYGEDDAPDMVEMLLRLAFLRGPIAPNVTNALLEGLDSGAIDFPLPDPAGGGAPGDPAASAAATQTRLLATLLMAMNRDGQPSPAAAQAVRQAASTEVRQEARPALSAAARRSSGRRTAGEQMGRRLMAIDRELRTRLLVASNDAMNRALERAGAKVRSRMGTTLKGELRNVSNLAVVARLGRDRLVAAGVDDADLLAGAWDTLEEQFMAWGSMAQGQAIEAANRIAGGFTQSQRDQLGLRLSDSLQESWGWMKEALSSLAEARLYDPHPAAPMLGEHDPEMRVPPGLVRQAVTRAGGTAGIETEKGGAWVSLSNGGREPAGGIATGELIGEALADNGVNSDGFVWDYGAAMRERPFDPHVELDGTEFANFDDPVLANTEGWPEFAFYMPGDHDGCMCDAVPILMVATTTEGAPVDGQVDTEAPAGE